MLKQCDVCVSRWVDAASVEIGIQLTNEERCQLIAGLLARRHLILSGRPESRKCELARALARLMTEGVSGRVCALQGHPWWAGGTGDVSSWVGVQSAFTAWKLVYFLESAVENGEPAEEFDQGQLRCSHVVCVEGMSPAELDFYFGELPYRLLQDQRGRARPLAVRFIGTCDSAQPLALDPRMLRVASAVHLACAGNRSTSGRPYSHGSTSLRRGQAPAVREV